MKRFALPILCALLLSGCSLFQRPEPVRAPAPAPAPAAPALVDENGAPIERIPFRSGVSSVSVERLAKAQGCEGGKGAGLVTPAGPVEVYKMQCDSGKTFTARCDLRQCKPM